MFHVEQFLFLIYTVPRGTLEKIVDIKYNIIIKEVKKLIIYAPAKINLTLNITKKRDDGYHEIETIMQTVSLYDILDIEKNSEFSLLVKNSDLPADKNNLVYKAAQIFFEYTKIKERCKIVLQKNIPFGAGLGGGSSDAAHTLIALNKLYNCNLDRKTLQNLALKLGADVPFFIIKGCCLARGIGEKLEPIFHNFKPYVLIHKPDFSISTKWAYENLNLKEKENYDINSFVKNLINNNSNYIYKNLNNTLENVSEKLHPEISEIKNKFINSGAKASLMTGSGSAIFGLFSDKASAERAMKYFDSNSTFLTSFC